MATDRTATVTILFTDHVASTEMLDRLGDDAATELHGNYFGLLRDAVTTNGGEEVKNLGDGLMVVFPSALDAVRCAIDMQQRVQRYNDQPGVDPFSVRIGIHAGEPIREDGDYFGTPVVVAKRLCDLARGGQILVSALVAGLIDSRRQFTMRDLGDLALRGIDAPIPAREVLWNDDHAATGLSEPAPISRRRLRRGTFVAVGLVSTALIVVAAVFATSSGDSRGGGAPASAATPTTAASTSVDLGSQLPASTVGSVAGDAISESTIRLNAAQTATIRVVVEGRQWYPLLQLVAPDGSVAAWDDDPSGGGSLAIAKLPILADGAYRARVTVGGGNGGRYRITFTADTPEPSKKGATTVVRQFGDGDTPIGFNGTAGQTATITVTPNPGRNFIAQIALLDPAGNQIASGRSASYGAARLTMKLPSTGRYSIVVSAKDATGGTPGSYRVDGEIV